MPQTQSKTFTSTTILWRRLESGSSPRGCAPWQQQTSSSEASGLDVIERREWAFAVNVDLTTLIVALARKLTPR